MKGKLILNTGEVFPGILRGAAHRTVAAEVVFSTSLTGYQEMLTDPSYREQILVCTTPHIGNVGINPWDMESRRVQVAGLVVQSLCEVPSSWRSHGSLEQWLKDSETPILDQVETRRLTLRLREGGVVKGWMGAESTPTSRIQAMLLESPEMVGRNLASVVTTRESYKWIDGSRDLFNSERKIRKGKRPGRVAVLDFGVKHSILRSLVDHGLSVTVYPATAKLNDVSQSDPDGIFLSNGPGDPAALGDVIENLKEWLGRKPIFGICLGHQLLSLAFGAKTYKLPFGHRGINHPVKNLKTGHVEITSQNHGFSVDLKSLPSSVTCTHLSLNDQTCEGIESSKYKAFSVQYHPESFPGPRDSAYLFEQFLEIMNL